MWLSEMDSVLDGRELLLSVRQKLSRCYLSFLFHEYFIYGTEGQLKKSGREGYGIVSPCSDD